MMLSILLDKGADIEALAGAPGGTPLHFATRSENCYLVSLLSDKGADITAKNKVRFLAETIKISIFDVLLLTCRKGKIFSISLKPLEMNNSSRYCIAVPGYILLVTFIRT
jgi:ankyrin repeat protein